ncbi:hypothetical protein K469DRAFT_730230 [Zopfia rhizophila CBS 207.26]|uniref:NAD(P)-binding protein n=1 Tax=Zopfia rhizophila CBS 207.26 TaxID=1314779 RepID=A0A6A6DPE1_9PEZI|nr:hypothetical protein K469DRAFT_730230 [Zopfia rhizophila CBS 207.26]
MTTTTPKILLTGAIGYVGGTVLHYILASSHPALKDTTISVPIRDLADIDFITEISGQHDIINADTGFHPHSAKAMVRGLARCKESTNKEVWMIHTSGCSNISDKLPTGQAFPDREWDDAKAEKIYEFEKTEDERELYSQRTSELAVLDTGIGVGVNAGMFQSAGFMIPIMMQYVLTKGYGFALGDSTGVIDHVHVSDLVELYVLCLLNILEHGGKEVPMGERGILFPALGRVRMKDTAQGCLDVAFAAGVLPKADCPQTKQVRVVDLTEAATTTAGNSVVAGVGWGSHRKTKGTVAKERLGWVPTKCERAWQKDLEDELKFALEGKRGVTIDGCIAEENGSLKK